MMKLEEIQNVAVIGAGTMGSSMALVFSQHGYHVTLYSRRQETTGQGEIGLDVQPCHDDGIGAVEAGRD